MKQPILNLGNGQLLMNNEDIKKWSVYVHINKTNKKIYIGISSNIKNRWRITSYDKKQAIRAAFEKYGWDGFEHIILIDNLTKEQAMECEKALIKKYDSQNKEKGYNRSPGGEIISDLRGKDSPFSKTTYQYDLEGNFIKAWDCASDAEVALNVQVTACCRGEYNRAGDWQWSYQYFDNIGKYIPPDFSQHNLKQYPRIYQFTTNGDLVSIIDDIHDFKQTMERKSILECCKGIRVQFENSIWLFEQDVNDDSISKAVYNYNDRYRKVFQFSLDGTFIKSYDNSIQAAFEMGGRKEAINHACSGQTKTAFGFQWRYENDCDGTNNIEEYINPNCKQVAQFNIDGDFVQYWDSIYKPNKKYGGNRIANAVHANNGSHERFNYLWFYKSDIEKFKEKYNLRNYY